jgi:hypothetical protein
VKKIHNRLPQPQKANKKKECLIPTNIVEIITEKKRQTNRKKIVLEKVVGMAKLFFLPQFIQWTETNETLI